MMRETQIDKRTWKLEFDSIGDFYKYICETPFNDAFRWAKHTSVEGDYRYAHTYSFEEAVDLFHNGWDDMAKKLTDKLKVIDQKTAVVSKPRTVKSVAGYQACVPRYLQGNPKSMISKQMTPVKQKVVNITKSMSYSCGTSTDEMIEESIKALQIVKKLEAAGYRVNLSVNWSVYGWQDHKEIHTKIKLKSANERLNISKLAFAMCHPSMLRRLCLRFEEVCPHYTKSFVKGYGVPCNAGKVRKILSDDIVLPAFINFDVNKVQTLDDLKGFNGMVGYEQY